MGLDVAVRDNPAEGRFEAVVDGQRAVATYDVEGDRITFTHTIVPEALEGRGVGSALVKTALASARERGLKVVPLCSFVDAYIKRHPELKDLLAN